MEEIDLKELFVTLWKKKFVILAVTLVFGLITFFIFSARYNLKQNMETLKNPTKLYYAETRFIVGTVQNSSTTLEQSSEIISDMQNLTNTQSTTTDIRATLPVATVLEDTYGGILKSKTSLNRIIAELELDMDATKLNSLISFSRVSKGDLLSVVVAYNDKDKVVQIATKLMEEFEKNMKNAYSLDKISIIEETHLLSDGEVSSALAKEIASETSIAKSNIRKIEKYTVIAIFLGFISSVGFIFLLETFNDTIKNEEFLEELSGSNILTIDKNKKDNKNKFAILKIKLSNKKTILVTSPEQNKDLSYISTNLASSYVNDKNKVLLLNLSSDKSVFIKEYDCNGLLDFINSENKDLDKFISKSEINNFDVLSFNSTSVILEEKQLKDLISSLEKAYSTIIINSDNLLENANTLALSKVIKDNLLVVTERKTKIKDLNKVKNNINEYVLVK